MSQAQVPDELIDLIGHYAPGTGSDRYARFAEDCLGLERTKVFDEIAKSLNNHNQTLVIGGNGLGKSYGTSALAIAALYCNPDTVVPVTAGNGDTVKNSIWKNIKSLWSNTPLPGRTKDSDWSLHTDLDEKWFLECYSPSDAEDLEGDHNNNVVYIVEEAEKPGVTKQHIDSARSTLAEDDHILVLANPPLDEGNVVSKLEERDSWNVLRFATWESRNSRVDRGLTDAEKIGGLSGVGKMRSDWKEYQDDPWPGIDAAIEISSPYLTDSGEPTIRESEADRENPAFREGLHQKWYKRRAGITPPDTSAIWRPFGVADVEAAYNRAVDPTEQPQTFGIDVARSGDKTIGSGKHDSEIRTHYARQGTNHVQQKEELTDKLYSLNSPEVAVDAVGEGSGLADELADSFAHVERFSNGMKPAAEREYYDAWAEALALFGEFLDSGGAITDRNLYEEAKVAARTVEFSTRTLTSRGGDVIEATPKDRIKDRLGHSPDYLDSALMCNWLDMADRQTTTVTRRKGMKARKTNTR